MTVSPSLRPLTIEDVREVEAWLTGEIEQGRESSGWSAFARIPTLFFGVFVDLAGLGDKSTLAESGRFRLGDEPSPRGTPREELPSRP